MTIIADSSRDFRKGLFQALLATAMAALFIIPWKLATESGSPETMVLFLVVIAAVLNNIVQVFQRGPQSLFKAPSKLELLLGSLFAILTLLGNYCSAQAVSFLSPALVATIMRAEVIIIAVLALIFLREHITVRFWFGILFVLLGFYIMAPQGQGNEDWFRGSFYALSASAAFASMAVITRKYIQRIDAASLNSIRLWLSVLFWFPLNPGGIDSSVFNWELLMYTGIAAILGPCLGRLIFMNSAKYIEAKIAGLAVSTAPIFALFFGIVFLSDFPSAMELLGGAVLLLGIAATIFQESPKKAQPVPQVEPS